MVENPKRLGQENWFFIENFLHIWTHSDHLDTVYSGVVMLIVHITRSIWLDLRRMMEKLDFIHWSELGSIVVFSKNGTISGEKKIQIKLKYTLGGIL
jgi:hypothetical protein